MTHEKMDQLARSLHGFVRRSHMFEADCRCGQKFNDGNMYEDKDVLMQMMNACGWTVKVTGKMYEVLACPVCKGGKDESNNNR